MEATVDQTPNSDITLYILCRKTNTLPYSGGVMNQPANIMEKWILIENALEARKKLNDWSNGLNG